jgi:mono/diheme cytochrome c family protein
MMSLHALTLSLAFTSLLLGSGASLAADAAALARGKYLYDAADCGGCHGGDQTGAPPAGGLALDTPFGTFYAPNITPDRAHGIGSWSEEDFHRALRQGVAPDGVRLFPVFPFTSFTNMSDGDVGDLYAYLTSLPAVAQPSKAHAVKPPFGWRSLLVFWRTLFFTPGPIAVELARGEEWNRGNYLVHAVAHCEECHTPRNVLGALKQSMAFSGNIGGPDGQNAPNITADPETGIGDWSLDEIERLLRTGMTPESDMVGSGMKAVVRGTSKLTDADRHAIAVYLKTVKPIHIDLPPPPKPVS